MKFKALFTLMLAGALTAAAQSQGYQDGIEYYKAGQYDNAKTILTHTLNQSGTDKALAYYYLGQTELALGNKAEAQKYFKAGIEANFENPYNYVGQGALQLLDKNPKAAEESFKIAQKYGKKNNEIIVDIARAYYNADPVAYAKEVDKYLAKAHKDSKHQEPAIYILEGDMLVDKEDYGSAAGKYEMATRYDAQNPEGYVKYANSYFRVNPQYAIDKLKEFLTVAPNSALAQRELAEKLYEGNFWKQASEQYGKYIQNPNHFPQDRARYAVLQYYGEDYANSLNTAKSVLAETPDNFVMQRLVFLNEANLGQNEAALRDGEAFFKNNPNGYFTSNDYITLSDVYSANGQDSLALVQVELAAEKFPENGDIQQTLSNVYAKNKQYVKSAEAYEKYYKTLETPSFADNTSAAQKWMNAALNGGDDTELRKSASAKGLEYINKAIAEDPDNAMLYRVKATIEMAGNGNVPDAAAAQSLKQMIEKLNLKPENADPANPNNRLSLYKFGYQYLQYYYANVTHEAEEANNYAALLKEITEKMAN